MMEHEEVESKFQCIHCGCTVKKLYHDYKAGITKLTNCKLCGNVVDKYVEYDSCIILLDVLLMHKPAYAHLLINVNVKSHWRAALLLWVIQAFVKLTQQRSEYESADTEENYHFIGIDLYLNYMVAAVELISFLLSVLAVLMIWIYVSTRSLQSFNPIYISKAILLCNLGSLLAMPALLWGKSISLVFVWFGEAFVCMSALQGLRVVLTGTHRTLFAVVAVACGIAVKTLMSNALKNWLHIVFSFVPTHG